MTYIFCFITCSCALYDFLQFSWRIIVSSLPYKQVWKAALLIVIKVFPMRIRSTCCVVDNSFSSSNFCFCFFIPCRMIKLHANSPKNYPSKWFIKFIIIYVRRHLLIQNLVVKSSWRFCEMRTPHKMFSTPKTFT